MPYANIEDERARNAKRRATDSYKAYQKRYTPEYYKANKPRFIRYSKKYRLAHPERYLLIGAKVRAKKRGIVFEIDELDIVIPDVCPVLGIPLVIKERVSTSDKRKHFVPPNAPSLDRIRPDLGYVKGNVQVISWRANNIKRDATPEELRKVADYVNRQLDV